MKANADFEAESHEAPPTGIDAERNGSGIASTSEFMGRRLKTVWLAVALGLVALTLGVAMVARSPAKALQVGRLGVEGECFATTNFDTFGSGSRSPQDALMQSGVYTPDLQREQTSEGDMIYFRPESGARREAYLVVHLADGTWLVGESVIASDCPAS